MLHYEYRVIPSPRKGEKAPGAKTVQERFAAALSALMNRMGRDGWEYLRADALPCEERVGLTGTKTTFQSMLVFRRALVEGVEQVAPGLTAAEPNLGFVPTLGAAEAPAGAAPALGPANPGLVAE